MIATLPFALALLAPQQTGWEANVNKSNTIEVPFEVHKSVVNSLQEALEAQGKRDYQLSLALLDGIFYKDGIQIALDPASLTPSASAKDGLSKAFQTWNTSLGSDNPVEFVGNVKDADLTIKFVEKIPRSGHDALGLIELKKEYRWNKSRYETEVTGTIYIQNHYDKTPLTAVQFSEVIAHELGHLIGLDDIDKTGQLMGPMLLDKPCPAPNKRETYAVQFLRNQAKKQWNSVLSLIQKDRESPDQPLLSYEENYLASCTVGAPCQHGTTYIGDLGGS